MSRLNKISAAALNVRLHPHSQDIYADWLNSIYKSRLDSNIHGDRYGMISSLDRSGRDAGFLSGVITTFTKFDDSGSWFNAEELREATDEQVSSLQIPHNMYPNASAFFFYFDIVKHRFYVQTYSKGNALTPNSALKFLSGLSRNIDITRQFGEAKITIVQDKASIDKIFSLDSIKSVTITILKPNTDIFDDDFETKIEAHLAESHSRRMSITYQAEAGASIVPTESIKSVGRVALDNGELEVSGRDESGAVTLNSKSYPLKLQGKYDPDVESEKRAFLRLLPVRIGTKL